MKPRARAIASVTPIDATPEPFWRVKQLEEMTPPEWESLCDGCARCCLHKLEEEDTKKIHFTNVGCALLAGDSCRCTDYPNRSKKVEDCVTLTPAAVRDTAWLPPSCAYRLLAEGKDLYWWHPLVSGDPDTVHAAGVSLRGRDVVCETGVREGEYDNYITQWPGRIPKSAREQSKCFKAQVKSSAQAGVKAGVKAKRKIA